MQACPLGILAKDRHADFASELAIRLDQLVGAILVKAKIGTDAGREVGEAARDQRTIGAIGLHGLDQRLATRREGDPLGKELVDDGKIKALEQRDPFLEVLVRSRSRRAWRVR